MTRKQRILTIALAAILFVTVIGITYAFFTATVTNNATPVTVTTTQLANLTMTSMKSDTGTPVYPGWVGWQGIDVQATGSGKAIYDLSLTISGDSAIKNDVQIEVCKIEDTTTALAANQVTFTAATPTVSNNQYSMTGGVVTLPNGCTSVVSTSTLTSLGSSVLISETGGKELNGEYRDRYYVKITYVNNPSAAQTQGQTFTITPSISTKTEISTISFVLNGVNYTATEGSTWAQWLPTSGLTYTISGNDIKINNALVTIYDHDSYCHKGRNEYISDVIASNQTYSTTNNNSCGGAAIL